ncbi:hypothetical protein MIH18_15415 [Marinobacter sp. M3C]|uniref:hypothetical protein n=1 Tax=unclassified Marinobacter TaxID=83889 RepID=UPI0020103D2A|nr:MULTISPECIES: hypothetical protein [unclassified Marinobacter]MCL1478281.1 hypothetical protein [Marinobacter sp.]MCL1480238.1 hypothetical protein [Marinobacter sp.]MCL1483892.1 hypothetical protein [Marinobacter sp.]MCL1487258.1 hypothetical protein [Marinobacter sp.]UQG55555.1 hypothetical protein MIH16_19535 [Marinobacter sp. M4C]
MERVPFLKPRMAGSRFDDHAIPLDMLKEFAVLEEMIVEVAKWHYLNDHPKRERSPRGFTKGISVKLTAVDEGSAMPDMSLFVDQRQLIAPANQNYFERARDSIVDAIEAAAQHTEIKKHLPEFLLGYFDKLGRGLRQDEFIDFAPEAVGRGARLNQTTRRALRLASTQLQELTEEVSLRGVIPEADQAKLTFEIETIGGQRVSGPIPMQHFDTIVKAFNGYRDGLRVSIQGIGLYNRNGQLKSMEEVEHVTLLDERDVGARIDELRLLKSGWLDGKLGKALDSDQLNWLESRLDSYLSDPLPSPYLYPTAEGGVQLEWSICRYEITLDINLAAKSGHLHALYMPTEEETELQVNLSEDNGWENVTGLLEQFNGESL